MTERDRRTAVALHRVLVVVLVWTAIAFEPPLSWLGGSLITVVAIVAALLAIVPCAEEKR